MMQFDPSSGWIWKRWKGQYSETLGTLVSKKNDLAGGSVLFAVKYPALKDYLSGLTFSGHNCP
jgi:hypothetical protein